MRPIMTTFTIALLSLIACGDWVEVRPSSAQDGPGGAGVHGTVSGVGGSSSGLGGETSCDCPAPPPPRKVELARAKCVGGFATLGVFAGALEFRDRAYDAWLHPTADETLGQQQALLQWGPEDGAFVRCPLGGEQMTATLWGFE